MKVKDIKFTVNEETFTPEFVVTVAIPMEPLQDNLNPEDGIRRLGEDFAISVTAALRERKEQLEKGIQAPTL